MTGQLTTAGPKSEIVKKMWNTTTIPANTIFPLGGLDTIHELSRGEEGDLF